MKKTPFKNKYNKFWGESWPNRVMRMSKQKPMKKFREVKGEDENVLQVDEADRQFSLQIRKRDGQCVNCGSMFFLQCSHYFGRGIYATRYDPLNCITLCQICHDQWEHEKDGVYKDFMIMWLGEGGFLALEIRSREKVSPYCAIAEFMKMSRTLQDNHIEY